MRTRSLCIGLASLSLVATSSPPTRFAAPQIIVAGGGPLHQRVVLPDFAENHRLMMATTQRAGIRPESLTQRPRIRIGMYWGFQSKGRIDLPDSVDMLAAANGGQPGSFYPATRGHPAIWVFGPSGSSPTSLRRITPEGLVILERHKIPTAVR